MHEYPPKLLDLEGVDFGSVLILSDGRRVPINVQPHRLTKAFADYDGRSLDEMIAGRSLSVFAGVLLMSEEEWIRIRHLVQASPTAEAVLRHHSTVWDAFREPYAVVVEMPHRVYGGLGQSLYTSHPFDFRPDPNRPEPWRRALLNAPDGWLIETWVELQTGVVEVTADVLLGHYVQ